MIQRNETMQPPVHLLPDPLPGRGQHKSLPPKEGFVKHPDKKLPHLPMRGRMVEKMQNLVFIEVHTAERC